MSKQLEVLDIFLILIVRVVSRVYAYVKTFQIVYFKYVQLIACPFYFNEAANKINKGVL